MAGQFPTRGSLIAFAGLLALTAPKPEGQRTEDRGQQDGVLPVLCPLSSVLLFGGAAEPAGPTDAQVKELQARYRAEREAVGKPPAEPVPARADELAKRADDALAAGRLQEAAFAFHEARFLLPALPAGLPGHVGRVLGTNRLRHADWVAGVAFSRDGSRLASGGRDGTARLWDTGSGRELQCFRGHVEASLKLVTPDGRNDFRGVAVALTPDGKTVASAGGNSIALWDADTGQEIAHLDGHTGFVTGLAFGPDGKTLLSGSGGDDRTVRLWDVANRKELVNLGAQEGPVFGVALSPNGRLAAAVSGPGQLRVWDLGKPGESDKPTLPMALSASEGLTAYAVAFSPDGHSIAVGGGNKLARLFGGPGPEGQSLPSTGAALRSFSGHAGRVTCVAFTPDGKRLLTGAGSGDGRDNTVRIWEVAGGRLVRTLQGHGEEVTCLAVSGDGRLAASGSQDQTIRLWSLDPTDPHRQLTGHKGPVWSAVVTPDGTLIASGGVDRVVRLWDAATGQLRAELKGHTAPVTAVAVSPDGKLLLSCGGDRVAKLWRLPGGEPARDLAGHTGPVMAGVFSKDSRRVLTGASEPDRTARLWNVETGQVVQTLAGHRAAVSAVGLSPDGKTAATGGADGVLKLWDLANGQEVVSLPVHGSGLAALAFGPEGQRLVTAGGDGGVKLWNLTNGRTPASAGELGGHGGPVSSVAFSADGRFVATGGADAVVRVWNAVTRAEVRSLRGHTDWVGSVAFAPDGRHLVSAGVEGVVRYWDSPVEDLAAAAGHSRQVTAVAVSGDGRFVVSGSDDRTVRVWDRLTGAEKTILAVPNEPVFALAISPDGKRLACTDKEVKLRLFDLATGKELAAIDTPEPMPVVQFTPDGKRLLGWIWRSSDPGRPNTSLQFYDAATLKPAGEPLDERDLHVSGLSLTPDGEVAALGATDGTVRIWRTDKRERIGGDLPTGPGPLADLVLTADRKRLVTGEVGGDVKVWDLEKRQVVKTVKAHAGSLRALAASADGKRFATFDGAGEVKVWDAETGQELRQWRLTAPVRSAAFTPDGKQLVTGNADSTVMLLDLP